MFTIYDMQVQAHFKIEPHDNAGVLSFREQFRILNLEYIILKFSDAIQVDD